MHKNDAQVVYGSCDTFDCLIVEQLENCELHLMNTTH